MEKDSWNVAVELVARFQKKPARLSHLLERMPEDWDAGRRRSCQSLLFGTVRHLRLLEKALRDNLRRQPKPGVWASLLVATRELMQDPERSAKIVHHAVAQVGRKYSQAEKGLANAVLRKAPESLRRRMDETVTSAPDLAWRYSHPEWRIERWLEQFGLEETRALLEWNQREPELFGRWQRVGEALPFLEATEWQGFFRVAPQAWGELEPHLEAGRFYVQNPAAGVAPQLVKDGFSGGRVLDLCSAPGGKALLLEALLGSEAQAIVAVDLPGPRFERMQENFRRYGAERIQALEADVLSLSEKETGRFEAVLLDAPCSNSGVLQRKVDARWRMRPKEMTDLLALQRKLLSKAGSLVAPGGKLVYSTCSVDREENEGQVAAFLASEPGASFTLEDSRLCLPWVEGRDGAAAFALRRASDR